MATDCDFPDGLDQTGWTKSQNKAVITMNGDCKVEFEYCFRVGADGECEVLLGKKTYIEDFEWLQLGEISCEDKYNQMREVWLDKIMLQIVTTNQYQNGQSLCLHIRASNLADFPDYLIFKIMAIQLILPIMVQILLNYESRYSLLL